jgi:hypothetical protein
VFGIPGMYPIVHATHGCNTERERERERERQDLYVECIQSFMQHMAATLREREKDRICVYSQTTYMFVHVHAYALKIPEIFCFMQHILL